MEMNSDEKQYSHQVKQSNGPHHINSEWDKEIWDNTKSHNLNNFCLIAGIKTGPEKINLAF